MATIVRNKCVRATQREITDLFDVVDASQYEGLLQRVLDEARVVEDRVVFAQGQVDQMRGQLRQVRQVPEEGQDL